MSSKWIFFFKAIKVEIQLNVLAICNYICIASDDINIQPFLHFPSYFRLLEKEITLNHFSVSIKLKITSARR